MQSPVMTSRNFTTVHMIATWCSIYRTCMICHALQPWISFVIWVVLIPHSQAWDEDNHVSKAPVTLTIEPRHRLLLQGNWKSKLTPFFKEELVEKYKLLACWRDPSHGIEKPKNYVPKIKVFTNKFNTMKFDTHKTWIHQYCKLYLL